FRGADDLEGSSSSRMNYVIAGLRMAATSPIVGVGVDRYPDLYEVFTPAFIEWGKRTAHSSWILVLAELGLPGLFLFSGIYVSSFREAYRARGVHPEYLMTLIGYGMVMSLLSHAYIFLPYLLFGLISGAARVRLGGGDFEYQGSPAQIPVDKPRVGSVLYRKIATISLLFLVIPVPAGAQLQCIADLDKPFGDTHPQLERKLSLIGSRGETLGFFILLPQASGCAVPTVKVLSGSLPKSAVSFSYLPYVNSPYPSYDGAPKGPWLDPVVPIHKERVCLSPDGVSWLLGEVVIPTDIHAQVVSGEIQINEMILPFSLRVTSIELSTEVEYPIYSEMTPWFNLLGHYGKWTEGEGEIARDYLQLLRAHRIETLTTFVSVPKVKNDSNELDIFTFPTFGQSFSRMNLEGRPRSHYFGFPTVPRDEVGTKESRNYLSAIEKTLPRIDRAGRALLYSWDEPQPEEFATFKSLLRDVRHYAPSLKILATTPYSEDLKSLVDIYVPVSEEIGGDFPDIAKYQELRKSGKEFWWYVSCMSHGCGNSTNTGSPDLVIDRPAVYIRSIGWIGPLLKTDAFFYYHVNNGYQFFPKRDPWKSLWDFSGNGDGTLVYPGRPGMFGLRRHMPIASLRLKLVRQASFDAQYVRLMESKGDQAMPLWWKEAKRNIVRNFTDWDRDYWQYSKLRERIISYLESHP
ncbi:MAG: DUF4091 domain-containing protein, partial [Bdellovibrionales bacterium]|nr:DUF4091 domain-containing protein [Bdellovibrionales bacterium]